MPGALREPRSGRGVGDGVGWYALPGLRKPDAPWHALLLQSGINLDCVIALIRQ